MKITILGHILTLFIGAAQLKIAAILQKKTGQIKHRLFIGKPAGRHIGLVVAAKQLLQLTAGAAPVIGAAEHTEPAEPLHGLPEGFGASGGHIAVDKGHLGQVFGQLGIFFPAAVGFQLVRHAV